MENSHEASANASIKPYIQTSENCYNKLTANTHLHAL